MHFSGATEDVPSDAVPVGATISVHAGETVPVDGQVIRGRSTLNRAILTGADLSRAVMFGACLRQTDLTDAITNGARGLETMDAVA